MKWFVLIPIHSVLSVYSVVLVDKITTDYTENTEKTLNKKNKVGDCASAHLLSTGVNSN